MLRPTRLFLSFRSRRFIQNFKYSIRIGDKPLGNIFFHPRIQFFMKKLTVVDYDKIFEIRKVGKPLKDPEYTFMTDQELKEEQERIKKKAEYLLQMPPLIDVTEDKTEVLSNDTSLDGHDEHHSKMIFTDISFDLNAHERLIVVREPNGLLRTANKNERSRMNQIYFPVPGRELHTPKMFEPEHLQDVLKRGFYEFILDRACVQFQPHEEKYHEVLTATFDYINAKSEFEKLIKTRHFGPFALYLAVNNRINNMLRFFLDSDELLEASFIVNIHRIVHSESSRSSETDEKENYEDLLSLDEACKSLKDYISNPSNQALELESTFNALVHKIKTQENLKSATLKAHGV